MIACMHRLGIQVRAGVLLTCGAAYAAGLRGIMSGGCSPFLDGLKDRELWRDCRISHGIVYRQGGTKEERKSAEPLCAYR